MGRFSPKPPWLKVRAPGGDTYHGLKSTLRSLDLYTVCEEARCPNVGECWREGTATVMLLGDVCTRGCRFCAVTTGNPLGAVDGREPEHVARAIASMGLTYVVLTMVNRDDLLDGGAEHVARTVRRLKSLRSDLLVETLVGDFLGHRSSVHTVVDAAPDVFAHNLEVVRSMSRKIRDARCGYDQTLEVLREAKAHAPERLTKSSLMVGIGETDDEVVEAMADLKAANVDVVTLGQYLRPSSKHAEVHRWVTPEQFDEYARIGRDMGFLYVASGPLVRSSYKAAEVFIRSMLTAEVAAENEGLNADDVEAVTAARLASRLEVATREAARVAQELGDADVVAAQQRVPLTQAHLASGLLAPRSDALIPLSRLKRTSPSSES